MFEYNATCTDVYDGDTITVDIDLGLHVAATGIKVRLNRINAPEMRGDDAEQGQRSRDWLRRQRLGKEVVLSTQKDKKGKYGRYLVEVYHGGNNINDRLVTEGLAEYKED